MCNLLQKADKTIDLIKIKLTNKKYRLYTDITGSVLFIVFAIVVFLLMPSQIRIKGDSATNGRTFPTLLMSVLILSSLILLIRNIILIVQKKPIPYIEIDLLVEVRALIIFSIFIVYYFLIKYAGFIFASIIFSLFMLAYFRCKKWSFYIIGIVAAVLIGVLFQYVFKVRLP